MSAVWLPLFGPNENERNPKGVAAKAWQMPEYKGIEMPEGGREWTGLRLDDWIVVDCDDEHALEQWLKHIDQPLEHTWVRKTPHGWHLFYKRTYANSSVQAGVPFPKTDLKLGCGHQVVFQAPGYSSYFGDAQMAMPFDASWIPERRQMEVAEEWSEMPEGIGDNSMISFAGTFRRWGMDEDTMAKCLAAIADITMTKDPMPLRSIRRLARQAAKYEPEESRSVICPKCATEVEYR